MSTIHPAARARAIRLRWIILSVSALAITTTGLAVAVPLVRQRSAIQRIEAAGGRIAQNPVGPGWLRDWVGDQALRAFDEVELIRFQPDRETYADRYPAPISTSHGIPWISGNTIDDREFSVVAEFPRFKRLHADWTNLSDRGLQHIAGLTELEELYLDGTDVSEASLSLLTTLRRLKRLRLRHTQFSEERLEELQRTLPTCEVLTRPLSSYDPMGKLRSILEPPPSEMGGMGGGMF